MDSISSGMETKCKYNFQPETLLQDLMVVGVVPLFLQYVHVCFMC